MLSAVGWKWGRKHWPSTSRTPILGCFPQYQPVLPNIYKYVLKKRFNDYCKPVTKRKKDIKKTLTALKTSYNPVKTRHNCLWGSYTNHDTWRSILEDRCYPNERRSPVRWAITRNQWGRLTIRRWWSRCWTRQTPEEIADNHRRTERVFMWVSWKKIRR